jgi:hypothetical protein
LAIFPHIGLIKKMYIREALLTMKRALLIIFLFYITCSGIKAQVSVNDSSVNATLIGVGYGYYLPAGDMFSRFGNNSLLQLSVDYKLKNYWTLGVNGTYLFGKTVKESIFDSISHDKVFINSNGDFGDVRIFERGFTVSAIVGRMFALNKSHPNSGIVLNMGIGFIQHKIRIEVIGNDVPQLSKAYKKGYDRLSNGLLLSQNLGYRYLSGNHLLNIYVGLECMEGFTESRRSFDYDKMERDTKKRLDVLYGAKIAWILPVYDNRGPRGVYTY